MQRLDKSFFLENIACYCYYFYYVIYFHFFVKNITRFLDTIEHNMHVSI